MKKNFIVEKESVQFVSTMRGVHEITGGSYKYLNKLLMRAEQGSEYVYRGFTIKVLRKAPNKNRGVDIN